MSRDEFLVEKAKDLVPFVTFSTKNAHYIYDAPTNQIVKTNAVINRIAKNVYRGEDVESSPEEAGEVADAERFLRGLQTHAGVLVPQAPKKVEAWVDRDHVLQRREEVVSLVLNVSEACNIRCSYCVYGGDYEGKRVHTNGKMSWEVAKKAIDYMATHSQGSEHNFRALAWYGGEPLTNFKLIKQTAKYFREVFPNIRTKFSTTSNATLWTKEIIDFFAEYEVDLLVSMDGPRELHDKHRITARGEGTFDRVDRNLKALWAAHPKYFEEHVAINAVLTPPLDFIKLDEYFSQFPIQVTVSTVDPPEFDSPQARPVESAGWLEMRRKFKQGAIERQYDDARFKKSGYGFVYYLFVRDLQKVVKRQPHPGFGEEIYGHGCCTPGQERLFVNVRGGFETCEKTEGNELMSLGDVDRGVDPNRTLSIFDKFNDMDYLPCKSCYNVRFCSLCFAHTQKSERFDSRKRYWNCENLRARTKEILTTYCDLLEDDPEALDFVAQKLR